MIVLFNESDRTFSAIDETREFMDPAAEWKKSHTSTPATPSRRQQAAKNLETAKRLQKNAGRTALAYGAAGAGLGAGAGALIARSNAKKRALAMGLEPGTPEYDSYVRKATIKGAAIGGVGTGAVAAGTTYGLSKFAGKSLQADAKRNLNHLTGGTKEERKLAKKKQQDRADLKKELSKGWSKLGNGITDRESAAKYIDSLPNTPEGVKKKLETKKLMRKLNLQFSDYYC